jgi:mRNA interferase YafQ
MIIKKGKKFKKDLKSLSNKEIELLLIFVRKIIKNEQIESRYCVHELEGQYSGYLECHLRPDLLLIYRIETENDLLRLYRIGSHSKLF